MSKKSIIAQAGAASLLLIFVGSAQADGWGDVRGKVVISGSIPALQEIKPNKDQSHCLSQGKLRDNAVVVDSKTMGVRNVMVWLAPLAPDAKLPIHPDLAAVPRKAVVIDQPCCLFEPRITMMREGQTLEIKNSAPVAHNARITGSPTGNGSINLTIPPAKSVTQQLRAEKRPVALGCDIHSWMGGRIGIFNHPYFAVTKEDGSFEIKNAPAGKYRILIQHEVSGWIHKGQKPNGQEIEIKAGGMTDLGTFETRFK